MTNPGKIEQAWRRHERCWADNLYVYAVVSRRSRGLSVGVNLNPDKACNFDCVYCQVDRDVPPRVRKVDLSRLAAELDAVLESARDGSMFMSAPFDALGLACRGVRDIAFSGDGEPTASPHLLDAVRIAAAAREQHGLDETKLVLITDAAFLSRPRVREALELLDGNNGEIWAKLDAGTDEYFRRVCRAKVALDSILENILDAARVRPVVIQSLWMRLNGEGPAPSEIEAYCERLLAVAKKGGQIKVIQLYTVARPPAEPWVAPLDDAALDEIAEAVRRWLPVPVEVYYGVAGQD
ncbi:MAG: radical SAM protein [Vicinamibacterales bacterium]